MGVSSELSVAIPSGVPSSRHRIPASGTAPSASVGGSISTVRRMRSLMWSLLPSSMSGRHRS